VVLVLFIYLFYDQIRRYSPPLGHFSGLPLRFIGSPALVVLKSTSGAINSVSPNKSAYLSAKRGLLKVALDPN